MGYSQWDFFEDHKDDLEQFVKDLSLVDDESSEMTRYDAFMKMLRSVFQDFDNYESTAEGWIKTEIIDILMNDGDHGGEPYNVTEKFWQLRFPDMDLKSIHYKDNVTNVNAEYNQFDDDE